MISECRIHRRRKQQQKKDGIFIICRLDSTHLLQLSKRDPPRAQVKSKVQFTYISLFCNREKANFHDTQAGIAGLSFLFFSESSSNPLQLVWSWLKAVNRLISLQFPTGGKKVCTRTCNWYIKGNNFWA